MLCWFLFALGGFLTSLFSWIFFKKKFSEHYDSESRKAKKENLELVEELEKSNHMYKRIEQDKEALLLENDDYLNKLAQIEAKLFTDNGNTSKSLLSMVRESRQQESHDKIVNFDDSQDMQSRVQADDYTGIDYMDDGDIYDIEAALNLNYDDEQQNKKENLLFQKENAKISDIQSNNVKSVKKNKTLKKRSKTINQQVGKQKMNNHKNSVSQESQVLENQTLDNKAITSGFLISVIGGGKSANSSKHVNKEPSAKAISESKKLSTNKSESGKAEPTVLGDENLAASQQQTDTLNADGSKTVVTPYYNQYKKIKGENTNSTSTTDPIQKDNTAQSKLSEDVGSKNNKVTNATDKSEDVDFDKKEAKDALGKSIRLNDLKIVEGIGPKIESLFHEAGIKTWMGLSKTPVDACKKILLDAGSRYKMHDPETWPEQSGLAAQGQWTKLSELQQNLKGGRKN